MGLNHTTGALADFYGNNATVSADLAFDIYERTERAPVLSHAVVKDLVRTHRSSIALYGDSDCLPGFLNLVVQVEGFLRRAGGVTIDNEGFGFSVDN